MAKLNEAAITALLGQHETGIGPDIALTAELVAVAARQNASGEVIGVKTGRLLGGIQKDPIVHNGEAAWRVYTDAFATTKSGDRIYYPAFHDIAGVGQNIRGAEGGQRPWLTQALAEVFEG